MKLSPSFIKQAIKGSYKLPFFEMARHFQWFIPTIPFHPISAGLLVTNNCNSRCSTCSMWKQKSTDELTTSEVEDALVQLRELGISNLYLAGGEPLLRQDLPQIISKAHELKFDRIHVVTNALLLTKQKAEELLANGLNMMTVSVNGIAEVHDVSRGVKGSYEKCVNALTALAELRDSKYPHLEIQVEPILMQPTLNQMPELISLCQRFKAGFGLCLLDVNPFLFDDVDVSTLMIIEQQKLDEVINELHRVNRKYPGLMIDTHASLEYARNYSADPKRGDIPCYLGYLDLYVGAHGEVYPGCWVLPPVGDLRHKRLKEIVGSKQYKQRLAQMFRKECPGCSCGHRLNLFAHFPSVFEEALWKLHLKNPKP